MTMTIIKRQTMKEILILMSDFSWEKLNAIYVKISQSNLNITGIDQKFGFPTIFHSTALDSILQLPDEFSQIIPSYEF